MRCLSGFAAVCSKNVHVCTFVVSLLVLLFHRPSWLDIFFWEILFRFSFPSAQSVLVFVQFVTKKSFTFSMCTTCSYLACTMVHLQVLLFFICLNVKHVLPFFFSLLPFFFKKICAISLVLNSFSDGIVLG